MRCWISDRLAIGPRGRLGARGWFRIGARPADGRAAPIVAYGLVRDGTVTVVSGAISCAELAQLREATRSDPQSGDQAR